MPCVCYQTKDTQVKSEIRLLRRYKFGIWEHATASLTAYNLFEDSIVFSVLLHGRFDSHNSHDYNTFCSMTFFFSFEVL